MGNPVSIDTTQTDQESLEYLEVRSKRTAKNVINIRPSTYFLTTDPIFKERINGPLEDEQEVPGRGYREEGPLEGVTEVGSSQE